MQPKCGIWLNTIIDFFYNTGIMAKSLNISEYIIFKEKRLMQWLESFYSPKVLGLNFLKNYLFHSWMKSMKTNSQGKKGFQLLPKEQPCSQKKQHLSYPEEQPHFKRKKKKFSLKTWLFLKKKSLSCNLNSSLGTWVLLREKPISSRNNELRPRKGPSSLGKHMFQKF